MGKYFKYIVKFVYCGSHSCNGCLFRNEDDGCVVSEMIPEEIVRKAIKYLLLRHGERRIIVILITSYKNIFPECFGKEHSFFEDMAENLGINTNIE